jgi:ketosteroid isomerase-like protein
MTTSIRTSPGVREHGAASPPEDPLDPVVSGLVRRAEEGHIALMQGDIDRYRGLLPLDDGFTLMSPMGSYSSRGNGYTNDEWAAIGRFFRHGRDSRFDLIRAYRGSDLIVLTGVEHTHVEVGSVAAQPWALRVTLVFRQHGDQWLLAHRHADPLGAAISVEQSAALARGATDG